MPAANDVAPPDAAPSRQRPGLATLALTRINPRMAKHAEQPPPEPPLSEQQAEDRRLAAEALKAKAAGKKPTGEQKAALRRVQNEREARDRERHYRTMPKRDYCRLSGRQPKVVNEQADRYGLALRGDTIDLYQVLKGFHDLLAKYSARLVDEDDELLDPEQTSPALERLREEKWKLARLDRLEREQQLVPREQIHELLGRGANLLRQAGERLQRQFGSDALEILNGALDAFSREIEQLTPAPANPEVTAPQ